MQKVIEKEVNINTKEIEALKNNFPSCFDKEGNFNIEKFQSIISTETNIVKESYKLDWLGKSYSRLLANTPVTTLLTEDIEHNSKPENKNSNNLYIEGDNLEVLKHLTNAYSEKVKMIYIDPPYNTGSDFIYQDDRKFTPEELSKMANIDEDEVKRVLDFTNSKSNSHSAWLTFMYPRLYIARELLKEDGVIFISIDDNEQAQLKLLCDEIFGESNFIGQFVVNVAPNGRDYGNIAKNHEYTLFYAKSINHCITNMVKKKDVNFKYNDDVSGFNIHPLYNSNEAFTNENRPNLYYPFYVLDKRDSNGFNMISLDEKSNYIAKVFPPLSKKNEVQFVWRWGKVKSIENLNMEIVAHNVKGEFKIVQKMRTTEQIIRSIVTGSDYTTRKGTELLDKLFGSKYFDFAKPVNLIEDFCHVGTDKSDIMLDFFSGSATTAHAVMDLNAKDGGNRKYIMVQLPEVIDNKKSKSAYDFCIEKGLEPIIPSIAKERIKRASKKIIEENQDKEHIKDLDFGFKVFKTKELENSNYLDELENFDPTREKLFADDILTIEELYSLALTWKTHDGVPLTSPFNTISLSSYEGLIVENRLYLMYANFTTEALQELLRYNDEEPEFLINQVIVYGLNFSSKHIKEIKEAIMMNNKKSASIELDVRY